MGAADVIDIQRRHSPSEDPRDLDAESSLLGSILFKPEMLDLVVDRVNPKDFYDRRHEVIFTAMLAVLASGGEPDLSQVCAWIHANNQTGTCQATYVVALSDKPFSIQIERLAKVVVDLARLRRARRIGNHIHASAWSNTEDVQGFLDRAEQAIHDVTEAAASEETLSPVDVIYRDKLQRWTEAGGVRMANGLGTGLTDLDALLCGIRPGCLVMLAARPGVGKSSLALNIATRAAVGGAGAVLFFSLEMTKDELVERQTAAHATIPLSDIRAGAIRDIHMTEAASAINELSACPMWIDDRSDMGMLEMRAKWKRVQGESRKKFATDRIGIIVVDYLQLMSEPERARNREQAIAFNTKQLKKLAKDAKCPVLCLSQMNRDIEKQDRRPQLSDLRESGAIEQDADQVWFIHKPKPKKKPGEEVEETNICELIVAKNRGGICGSVGLYWNGGYTRFDNLVR